MRLLCNGVALDLESGATMAFKKLNPLFAFDDLTCERTQAFSLPSTPTNERVLELAKIPAYDGRGMRVRFDAELQDGVVVKKGYLYVDKYSKGKYSAIFVTGELLGLQRIKNAGKIAKIIECDEVVEWSAARVVSPSLALNSLWAIPQYIQEGETPHPSYSLRLVINKVTSALSLPTITLPTAERARYARAIVGDLKLINKCAVTFARTYENAYSDPTQVYPPNIVNGISATSTETPVSGIFGEELIETEYSSFSSGTRRWTLEGRVRHWVTKQPISITFPSDWPQTTYIGKATGSGLFESAFEFYGDRSFRKTMTGGTISVTRTGVALAGRTIQLAANTPFIFISESDYLVYESQTTTGTQGWQMNQALTVNCTIEGDGDAAECNVIRLQDNLPDMTLIELLKAIASISGTALYYTEADGVAFDPVSVGAWEKICIDGKVLDETDVERRFGDYVQRNVVRYDSDETVADAQRIKSAYTIQNDNLDAERDLQVIPFSEGGAAGNDLQLRQANKSDTLAKIITGGLTAKLNRHNIPLNAGIQALCDASTSIRVSVRMTLADFEAMSAKVVILYNGTQYVWTEATWQNNVCTCKISKI